MIIKKFLFVLLIVFLIGTVFPDSEYLIQKDFFKNNCYEGIVKQPITCHTKSGFLHNYFLWIAIGMFSLGMLLGDKYGFKNK